MARKGQLDSEGRLIKQELLEAARLAAMQHLPDQGEDHGFSLVCAVVEQESHWAPCAVRYEEAFEKRYIDPIEGLSETEKKTRSTSWGLMQLMGQVARELGFKDWLPVLCAEPSINLQLGCLYLARKIARCDGDIKRALQEWNGGGNANYADEVLARMPHYQEAAKP